MLITVYISLGYKSQHTLKSLEEMQEKKAVSEATITEEALIKLFKITLFIVK